MSIFDTDNILEHPRAIEVVTNMTEDERKNLKTLTIKYISIIFLGYISFTILFIIFLRSLSISYTAKWFFAVGYLVFGFVISKFVSYWILKKQKKYLESTKYACMLRIDLSE